MHSSLKGWQRRKVLKRKEKRLEKAMVKAMAKESAEQLDEDIKTMKERVRERIVLMRLNKEKNKQLGITGGEFLPPLVLEKKKCKKGTAGWCGC
jgi:hypothetical protein